MPRDKSGDICHGVAMSDEAAILSTLEQVAEAHGDPRERVYQTLFTTCPELEALFVMDRDGAVRGEMLAQALECIIDFAGPRQLAPQMLNAARLHHDGYGLPDGAFDLFFPAIRDTFKALLGEAWTPAMEDAWARLIEELRQAG